jgi:hypothetical protein
MCLFSSFMLVGFWFSSITEVPFVSAFFVDRYVVVWEPVKNVSFFIHTVMAKRKSSVNDRKNIVSGKGSQIWYSGESEKAFA